MQDDLERQLAALELLTRELISITASERLADLAAELGRTIRESQNEAEAVVRGRALSVLDCVLITADDSLEIPPPRAAPARRFDARA